MSTSDPAGGIRGFQWDDYEAVLKIWTQAGFRIGPSETRDGIALVLAHGPELFLVAEQAGETVGAVLGAFDGRRGWIYHLAVEAREQQRGIGAQLLSVLEARLRARGSRKVNLHVRPANRGVVGFYERQGYQLDELIYMEKWLDPPPDG